MKRIDKLSIDTLRVLSVDQIEKAKSGHPGMPLGASPIAYTLWANHMNFSSKDSKWINRDRFVLSAGHASALYYSLLHLFGFDVAIEDLKNFRQLDSKTPGHPEFGHTDGVEATTGPLGAGLSNAVGLAMAQEHLAAKYNKEGFQVINNYTFVLAGDGCMMEGITSEASSLAGTLNLGRLIVIYDSNNITIEGDTDLAFVENVRDRYKSYGFETFLVEDGNDINQLHEAITQAKKNIDKPSFIEVKTRIGYGSSVEGTNAAHGAPLGGEGVTTLRTNLDYPSQEPFYVPAEVYNHFGVLAQKGEKKYYEWTQMFGRYREAYPELAEQWDKDFTDITEAELLADKTLFEFEDKPQSTRNISGVMINRLKDMYPNLIGGSADLSSSNMTHMENESSFSSSDYKGRNIHFGVREQAMAAVGNGLMLYGGLKAYVATFFVFSDYLKPMARLSALSNLPLTYILTHDSIGVGEDGPTHEPIEQLAMMRTIPNFITFRPADAVETAYGWVKALSSTKTPVALVLSRQNLPQLENTGADALKGAYVVKDSKVIDAIIIASGSEVSLAIEAASLLEKKGVGIRVVSMPSMELFENQTQEYKDSILPVSVRKRVSVEAGTSFGWHRYVGLEGNTISIDTFGASAPGDVLFQHFGFTANNIVKVVENIL